MSGKDSSKAKEIVVIGAGPMGLMCAYELLKKGHKVKIYERDDRIGGMTASFNLDGLKIERFYHFICATDTPYFALLKELGIYGALRWRETKMGFYYNGRWYKWGDPIALLTFPKLDLISKLRYGLHVFYCKGIKDWTKLDQKPGIPWLKKWVGEKAYMMLWNNLLHLKFFELSGEISAAWIASRIRRMAQSRKSLFVEELGYLEGGSDTLLDAMEKRIRELGGEIHLRAQIQEVVVENGKVTGVRVNDAVVPCAAAISTIPLPYVSKLVPALSPQTRKSIEAIRNIGVACVVMKLRHSISGNFWTNITDPSIEVPGIIEYSNLNPATGETIVYLPYYMPSTHPKYSNTDAMFIDEVRGYLKRLNPAFDDSWILSSYVGRYGFAQTVCTPHFFAALPPMSGEIEGFVMADTSYYYPEDRSISESVGLGRRMAELSESGLSDGHIHRIQESRSEADTAPIPQRSAGRA